MSEYTDRIAEEDSEKHDSEIEHIDEEDSEDDEHIPNEYDTTDPFIADEESEEEPEPITVYHKRRRPDLDSPREEPRRKKHKVLKRLKKRSETMPQPTETREELSIEEEEERSEMEDAELDDERLGGYEDAKEIFGDDFDIPTFSAEHEYEEEEEVIEEQQQEPVKSKYEQLKKVIEPDELAARYLTEKDEQIREADIPERLQTRHGLNEKRTQSVTDTEIKEEAEWIFKHAPRTVLLKNVDEWSSEEISEEEKEKCVEQIKQVLTYLLRNFYDVPFISKYRQEHITHLKNDAALWEIYEWDKKWYALKTKKDQLNDWYNDTQEIDDMYFNLLKECDNIEDANDLIQHYQLHYIQSAETNRRRPARQDRYKICKKSKVANFAKLYGLTPQQYAENLQSLFTKNVTVDHEKDPDEIVFEYVDKHFPKEDSVLNGARFMIAHEIAHEPIVRQKVRSTYLQHAVIKTTPTPKGKQHATNDMIDILDLQKPIDEYTNNKKALIEFLKILKAETLGFLTLSIELQEDILDQCLEYKTLYFSDKLNVVAQNWNKEREMVMVEVKKMLRSMMEQYVKITLTREARKVVADECEAKFEKMINVGKVESTDYPVLACCVGSDETEKTTFVALDSDGEVLETLQWDFIPNLRTEEGRSKQFQQMEDVKRLVMKHDISVIALGTTGIAARRLHTDLLNMFDNNVKIYWVSHDVAKIYEVSEIGKQEYPYYSPIIKRAISIGRRLQEPLFEFAKLFNHSNEVLFLKLHPLQDMIPKEELLEVLEKQLIRVTCKVGVDINRIVQHKHMQPILQFVCGLGPRKANYIIDWINSQQDRIVYKRKDLLGEVLEKNVFINCIGFLKIKVPPNYDTFEEVDAFDETRIHPESYDLALKMVVDALDVEDPGDESQHQAYIKQAIKESNKLDELDLVAYANELEKRKMGKKNISLFEMKEELQHPFKDPREPYQDINEDELFYLITGETKETLGEGQLTTAVITSFTRGYGGMIKRINCTLPDFGLFGFIPSELAVDVERRSPYHDGFRRSPYDYDEQRRRRIEELFEVGQTIPCIIEKIDKSRFSVTLDARESAIRQVKERMRQPRELKPLPKKKRRPRIRRTIEHPSFQNMTYPEAKQHLLDKQPGEVVFRPSSKGYDHIALTLKFFKNQYINLDIVEKDKKDNFSLGRRLLIGKEVYEDLDEILFRHVEPMMKFAAQMMKHRKYVDKSPEDIEEYLRKQKESNRNYIPYCITLDSNYPGRFVLYYLPNKTIRRQYVGVTPLGYSYAKRTFKNPDKLFNAFKRSYASKSKSRRQEESTTSWG